MVEANKDEDMCDGMQCINHPFTKNPGGICALCLQEKLGKLVTSSFPLPKHLSSSSSSSPSFRSDTLSSSANASASAASLSLSLSVSKPHAATTHKLPFLLAKKKKKMLAASSSSSSSSVSAVYKRSQSTTASRNSVYGEEFSPRKRNGFWSFLHLYSSKHHSNNSNKKAENFHGSSRSKPINSFSKEKNQTETITGGSSSSSSSSSMSKRVVNGVGVNNKNGIDVIVEEDGSPNIVVAVTPSNGSSFERKVSRSRSVGCGSRSFSGDFFERITNGFGDCTLRRVESQREGNGVQKSKVSSTNPSNGVREMVRCGGIFGGFMIMTSSSSSSSSSSWVSSSSTDHNNHQHNNVVNGKNRSWGWSFASPMRAFTATTSTKTSSSGKRGRTITDSAGKNTTKPNLAAIPSLLAVRS